MYRGILSPMPDRGDPNAPRSHTQAIHAPWRLSYMEMLGAEQRGAGEKPSGASGASFLRDYWLSPADDAKNHVIVRTGTESMGRGGLVMLNRYPYANGHLLVCLGAPRSRLLDYDDAQRAELWSLVDLATELCEATLEPQGVNIGVNQGSAAGAGVPEHVHVHVVPRWAGDVNFMSVCAQVRVIPSALDDMARRYGDTWARLKPKKVQG